MNKSLFFLLLLTGFLWGCRFDESPRPISVSIELTNLPRDVQAASLEELNSKKRTIIDTASVKDGKIAFRLFPHSAEVLHRVNWEDGQFFLVIIKDKSMSIKGDFEKLGELTFTGSAASTELQNFIDTLRNKEMDLNSLQQELHSKDTVFSDSLLQIKQAALDQKREALSTYLLQTAENTQSPVVALFAAGLLPFEEDKKEELHLFQKLYFHFPNHPQIREIKEHLDTDFHQIKKSKEKDSTSRKTLDSTGFEKITSTR